MSLPTASDNVWPKLKTSEGTAWATPASGFGVIYEKTDGLLYFKNDGGTEYDLTAAGGGGGSVVFYDEGAAVGTAAIINLVGSGVSGTVTSGTAVITISGGTAAGPWGSAALSASGASFTGWTNDISSHWSSDGTVFICNPGTSTTGKARFTTNLFTLPARIDCEMFFDSTGTSEAGGSLLAIGIGSSANPSRGPVGGLKMVSNNPAVNGQAYIEEQGQTGFSLATTTFALDTWIPMRIDIASSQTVTVSRGGTVIASESWNQNTGPYVLGSLILVAYEAKVRVRNIAVYQLT